MKGNVTNKICKKKNLMTLMKGTKVSRTVFKSHKVLSFILCLFKNYIKMTFTPELYVNSTPMIKDNNLLPFDSQFQKWFRF